MPQTRKTRGPRTPDERAHDAARSTATLFERLPTSGLTDGLLRPIATMLRFYTRPMPTRVSLRDVRQLEKADREFVDFMSREGKYLEYLPAAEGLEVEAALQRVQGRLREAKALLAAKLAEEADDA
jgi:hypothetical protein